ncbi:MAG TPA: hypothetical protein ENL05_00245 [Candidatus Moranbacteria bacterium]|nr:hypothetical protein [Candidatus Moranbacteria bacterium]
MKKVKLAKQKYRASALVASLLILSATLITALGMAAISVKEMNISLNSSKSSQAFQIADGGLEIALKKIKKDGWTTVKDFKDGGMTCKDGAISDSLANGDYKLTFENSSGILIDKCENTDTIASIKSVGKYRNVNRAIEMVVP